MTSRRSFATLATAEWVMVLPAAILFTAAIVRQLQPRQYEPARTAQLIVEWAMSHVARSGAAMLFIGLPLLVCAVGAVALWKLSDEQLHRDAVALLSILWRNAGVVLFLAAVLVAATILGVSAIHVITD